MTKINLKKIFGTENYRIVRPDYFKLFIFKYINIEEACKRGKEEEFLYIDDKFSGVFRSFPANRRTAGGLFLTSETAGEYGAPFPENRFLRKRRTNCISCLYIK